MIRLSHLERLFEMPVAAWLSRALGYNRTALTLRVRRGSPEVTPEEAEAIRAALAAVGLRLIEDEDAPPTAR